MRGSLLTVGLGHLARFILEENKGLEISGTYRDKGKVLDFDCKKHYFDSNHMSEEVLASIPFSVDYILLNTPPLDNYEEVIVDFDKHFKKETKFIFISSTGVYGPPENGSEEINESSTRNGTRSNAKKLIKAENTLRELKRDIIIIRPGGLIDEKRNPARALASREVVLNSNQKVNIIHTRDVARFIFHVIERELWGEEFNIICDCHDTKEKFYSREIKKLGLQAPRWENTPVASKVISNKKAKSIGFQFVRTFSDA